MYSKESVEYSGASDSNTCKDPKQPDHTSVKVEKRVRESEEMLEYFFTQSLDGFFFMMLEEPIYWNESVNKEEVLDYVFHHQHMTRVNKALLDQYRATEDMFLGLTPYDLFKHDLEHGRHIWRGLFDKGRWHVETDERRLDGTQMFVEGDYICIYDSKGRITGHFGVQTDISRRMKREREMQESRERAEGQRTAIFELVHHGGVITEELTASLHRITRVLSDTIGVERSSILVFNEDGTSLETLSLYRRERREHSEGQILEHGELPHYMDRIRREGSMVIENVAEDSGVEELDKEYFASSGVTSLLYTGILVDGELKGILRLEHVGEHRKWYPDEEIFVSTIASMVAQVLITAERRKIKESLLFQLKFEKVVSQISSYFVGLSNHQFSDGMDYTLRKAGELFLVDRCYLFQFSEDGETMSNTHEWCQEGIDSHIERKQDVLRKSLPWWNKKIDTQEYIYIADVDRLPEEAAIEREMFLREGIHSLLNVPILIDGKTYGFIGFDLKERIEWTDHHIVLLKVITELISNTLKRFQAHALIHHLSFHDQLTNLYNRHYLEEEMKRYDTSRQLPISIIMADLNGLKLVNDIFGHREGDQLLKKTASILCKACRKEDSIARWGGDEFVIFLPQTSREEANRICRRIKSLCSKKYIQSIPLSIALGVGVKEELEEDLYLVLSQAEESMYKNKLSESYSQRNAFLTSLVDTLQEKSQETKEHTKKARRLARRIGERIGLLPEELCRLDLLVSLHDIGNIVISSSILNKPGKLSEEEWTRVKRHPEVGYRIARSIEEISHISGEILAHHERWDGLGYPKGLAGKEIPLLARINTLIDAYDVMISGRPYKEPMAFREVVEELKRCANHQFDPELLEVFLEILEEEEEEEEGI